MRAPLFFGLIGIFAFGVHSTGFAAAACDPEGAVKYICGPVNAEDEVKVPGEDWVVTTGMGRPGHLYLINARDNTWSVLYPSETARPPRPDKRTYPDCAGPVDQKVFGSHGLNIRRGGRKGLDTLYVVNHSTRESIEVFELDTKGHAPSVAWVGCVIMPPGMTGNAVAPLPDGGLVATNFRYVTDRDVMRKMGTGENTGNVQQWSPATGWKTIPNSEMSAPNGIETSKDGHWVYVAATGTRSVYRLSLGQDAGRRDTVALGLIMPDNLKWTPDGQLLVAGHATSYDEFLTVFGEGVHPPPGSVLPYAVLEIDPQTLKVREIVAKRHDTAFGNAATAIEIGDELWVSPSKGDRIARIPLHR